MRAARSRFIELENRLHRRLIAYSIPALRLSVGLVFLVFGFLKVFPGVSPAQELVERTTDLLTLGLVPGSVALLAVATLECFIGLCFLAGRWMRLAIWLLAPPHPDTRDVPAGHDASGGTSGSRMAIGGTEGVSGVRTYR